MTHLPICQDSFTLQRQCCVLSARPLVDMCDMTHPFVCRDTSTRMRRYFHTAATVLPRGCSLIDMCDGTHPLVCHDSYLYAKTHSHCSNSAASWMLARVSICVTRRIYLYAITHLSVFQYSFTQQRQCCTMNACSLVDMCDGHGILIHEYAMTYLRVYHDSFTLQRQFCVADARSCIHLCHMMYPRIC